jgi:hypothetical protein
MVVSYRFTIYLEYSNIQLYVTYTKKGGGGGNYVVEHFLIYISNWFAFMQSCVIS